MPKEFTHELTLTVRVRAKDDDDAIAKVGDALAMTSEEISGGAHAGTMQRTQYHSQFEIKRTLPVDTEAEPIFYTDRLDITVKIDEPNVEAKIPAIPSGGGSSNDAGCLTYKITPNFTDKEAIA